MKIGFIGLGIMGSRMAANLQRNGRHLIIHNRTREKAAKLLASGAEWADVPASVAPVDILFTMLAHPDAIRETALGSNGFLDQMSPGSLWVDCSTVNPFFSRQIAAEAAQNLLAASMATFAEGIALARAQGFSQEMLFNVLLGGPVVAPFVGGKREKMSSGNYKADFPLRWMQKDLQMTAVTAYETGVPMPLTNAAKELYQQAIQNGWGEQEFSAIYAFLNEG